VARAAQKQAKDTYDQSTGVAKTAGSNAGNIYSTLEPQLQQEAANPQGYGESELSHMNTAVGQATGGSVAGAVGQGNLDAARTGNRGGYQTTLDESARNAQRTNADAALSIEGKNADLKQRQQQAGIAGLGALHGEESADQLKALGLEDQATNTGIEAGKSGWFQNLMNFANTAANVGKRV